jgi:hypothetical protein
MRVLMRSRERIVMTAMQEIDALVTGLVKRFHSMPRDVPLYEMLTVAFDAGLHKAVIDEWSDEDLDAYLAERAHARGEEWPSDQYERPEDVSVFSEPFLEEDDNGVIHTAE